MTRILIVDDEQTNLEVASIMCQGAGYEHITALNGQDALDLIRAASAAEVPFNLVLLDVLMPVLDGITLTKVLRADPAFAELPILGMTAKAGKADIRECLDAGMNAVLTKPFTNRLFIKAVAAVLDGHKELSVDFQPS